MPLPTTPLPTTNDDQAAGAAFARLLGVMRELRRRCPWDRAQTLATLGKHLVEEAYEALEEIDNGGNHLGEELGDLIAQVIAVAVIAEEERRVDPARLLGAAADKLVRRHPHVYDIATAHDGGAAQGMNEASDGTGARDPGDRNDPAVPQDVPAPQDAAAVVAAWNRIKAAERTAAGATSALDGVARALPALLRAEKLGARARDAGMDWHDIHDVLAKVREEMDEVEGALARNDADAAAGEIGDMLLALANAPRFIEHNAEETLRRSCDKFTRRFVALEHLLAARALDLKQLAAAEIEALWQEVKRAEAK